VPSHAASGTPNALTRETIGDRVNLTSNFSFTKVLRHIRVTSARPIRDRRHALLP
jgi:hypothetical protein